MDPRRLFSPVKVISPADAKEMIDSAGPEGIILLDVRQPKEYERVHLPGAVLIPIAQLSTRLHELDGDKPIIVYCASGNRSSAAARLLYGAGFKEVYSLGGGIKAWRRGKAVGGPEFGLEAFAAKGDFKDVFAVAYSMEHNLGRFYSSLSEGVKDEALERLLLRLAAFEEHHKALLLKEWGGDVAQAVVDEVSGKMEGGFDPEEELEEVKRGVKTPFQLLEIAMAIEAQAMDMYWRLLREESEHREFFTHMMGEEANHLKELEREIERLVEEGAG